MSSNIKTQYNGISINERNTKLSQGDILTDFKHYTLLNKNIVELTFPYVIIMSQACDLANISGYFDQIVHMDYLNEEYAPLECNQFLPNVLIVPAFSLATVLDGTYLLKNYKIKTTFNENIDYLKSNTKLERYHYLFQEELALPELVVDFKCFFSESLSNVLLQCEVCHIGMINELFRERLSQRFTNYLSRIGLPELGFIDYYVFDENKENLSYKKDGVYVIYVNNTPNYYRVIGGTVSELFIKNFNQESQKKLADHIRKALKQYTNKAQNSGDKKAKIPIKEIRSIFENFI